MVEEKECSSKEPKPARQKKIGAPKFVNIMESQDVPKPHKNNELMYVEVRVRSKTSMGLIDTGATRNFISKEEMERLDLVVTEKKWGRLKAVKSEVKPILGCWWLDRLSRKIVWKD